MRDARAGHARGWRTYGRGNVLRAALHPNHQSLIRPARNFQSVQIKNVSTFEDEQEQGAHGRTEDDGQNELHSEHAHTP